MKVENTAADGNDPKKAVFHSAGEHLIVVRAEDEDDTIEKAKGAEILRAYIGVFCGQDVAKGIKDDEIFPLDDEDRDLSERQCALELDFSRYLTENSGWLVSA